MGDDNPTAPAEEDSVTSEKRVKVLPPMSEQVQANGNNDDKKVSGLLFLASLADDEAVAKLQAKALKRDVASELHCFNRESAHEDQLYRQAVDLHKANRTLQINNQRLEQLLAQAKENIILTELGGRTFCGWGSPTIPLVNKKAKTITSAASRRPRNSQADDDEFLLSTRRSEDFATMTAITETPITLTESADTRCYQTKSASSKQTRTAKLKSDSTVAAAAVADIASLSNEPRARQKPNQDLNHNQQRPGSVQAALAAEQKLAATQQQQQHILLQQQLVLMQRSDFLDVHMRQQSWNGGPLTDQMAAMAAAGMQSAVRPNFGQYPSQAHHAYVQRLAASTVNQRDQGLVQRQMAGAAAQSVPAASGTHSALEEHRMLSNGSTRSIDIMNFQNAQFAAMVDKAANSVLGSGPRSAMEEYLQRTNAVSHWQIDMAQSSRNADAVRNFPVFGATQERALLEPMGNNAVAAPPLLSFDQHRAADVNLGIMSGQHLTRPQDPHTLVRQLLITGGLSDAGKAWLVNHYLPRMQSSQAADEVGGSGGATEPENASTAAQYQRFL